MAGFEGDLIGRALSARYRLTDLLGTGSSARVYLADDVQLSRRVAVKVLHASLAEDPEFLRRFRVEAEALGQLDHENIVTVHDFNDGNNALNEPPYLVTNYLEGGSLRNLLDQGYRLTPSQAVRLGLDAARGLASAHARGYVHRDVKPANLLFTMAGRACVADFGLARAKAEAARTEADGALFGTMRYISPEQVTGDSSEKSDVYSLALVIVESVTGVVPFSRDNWQSTVFARTREDLRAPEVLGSLASIINAAGVRDPALRIDAETFAVQLEDVARALPRANPLPLDGARILARGRMLDGRDPTRLLSGRGSVALEPAMAVSRMTSMGSSSIDGASASSVFDQSLFDDETVAPTAKAASPSAAPEMRQGVSATSSTSGSDTGSDRETSLVVDLRDDGSEVLSVAVARPTEGGEIRTAVHPPKPIRRLDPPSSVEVGPGRFSPTSRFPRLLAAVALLALLAGVIGALVVSRQPELRDVPSVEGIAVGAAIARIETNNLVAVKEPPIYDATVASGVVISQKPLPARRVKKGDSVSIVISKGQEPIAVPDLAGLTFDQSTAVLARTPGLTMGSPPRFVSSETVARGMVISWSPRGPQLPGTTVNLVVSSGPATVLIPKVSGLSSPAAKAALPPKLNVTVVETFADGTPKGLVIGTNPKSGSQVDATSNVRLFVSLGPATVVVPSVIDQTVADATAQLRTVGLKVGSTIGSPDQPVLHTRPVRRSKVKRGTVITLYTTSDGVPPLPGDTATLPASASESGATAPSPTTKTSLATTTKASTQTTKPS